MAVIIIKDIAVSLGHCGFLEPYIRRAVGDGDDESVKGAVRIVTDDHDDGSGDDFEAYCGRHGLQPTVIRCQHIVGTGMTGLPRRIAAGIYRGTYVHIRDNSARISVVHAVDVARAVAIAAGTPGVYTLTDGTDPAISDLAEALAYRLGDKRIITIPARWARLWYGRRYYETLTSSHCAVCDFTDTFPAFRPVEVINYLRNHVYDEQSL